MQIFKEELFKDIENLARSLAKLPNVKPLLSMIEEAFLSLFEKKQILSISEIKETLKMDAYKVSRILESLENYRKGKKRIPLVKRSIDPDDMRNRKISITRYGKEIMKENSNKRIQRLEILFGPLNEDEIVALSGLVRKMLKNLSS